MAFGIKRVQREFVYFGLHPATGLVKIGFSRNAKTRMASLGVRPIGAIPGGLREEREVHRIFDHLRIRKHPILAGTEWFSESAELLEYVRRSSVPVEDIKDSNSEQVEIADGEREPVDYGQSLMLTVKQVAEKMQVKEATVRLWLRRGLLKGIRVGKSWRISQETMTLLSSNLGIGDNDAV